MKIIAINGSYRKTGNTYHMVEKVLLGCRDAGGETEHIILLEKDIKPCLGCLKCFYSKDEPIGECVQKDDMRGILESIIGADAMIVACPIYFGNMSSVMVKFLHRMGPLTYDKAIDGGLKGVPVYKNRDKKPGMYITSMIAPFPINHLFSTYRAFYKHLKNILKLSGYRTKYALVEGGAEMKVPIPEREKFNKKAFSIGSVLAKE